MLSEALRQPSNWCMCQGQRVVKDLHGSPQHPTATRKTHPNLPPSSSPHLSPPTPRPPNPSNPSNPSTPPPPPRRKFVPSRNGALHLTGGVAADPSVRGHRQRHPAGGVAHVASGFRRVSLGNSSRSQGATPFKTNGVSHHIQKLTWSVLCVV